MNANKNWINSGFNNTAHLIDLSLSCNKLGYTPVFHKNITCFFYKNIKNQSLIK